MDAHVSLSLSFFPSVFVCLSRAHLCEKVTDWRDEWLVIRKLIGASKHSELGDSSQKRSLPLFQSRFTQRAILRVWLLETKGTEHLSDKLARWKKSVVSSKLLNYTESDNLTGECVKQTRQDEKHTHSLKTVQIRPQKAQTQLNYQYKLTPPEGRSEPQTRQESTQKRAKTLFKKQTRCKNERNATGGITESKRLGTQNETKDKTTDLYACTYFGRKNREHCLDCADRKDLQCQGPSAT